MRKIMLIMVLVLSFSVASAQKYLSKSGHIWFYSHTPMEDIEAHNRQVVSIINTVTGEVDINLLIKSFLFKNALMQEHFNENYMESDKFPKASFKGFIQQLSNVNWGKDGIYSSILAGNLTIHGVTKSLNLPITITIKDGKVSGKASFTIDPKEFNISIPSLVENKIAKEMDTQVEISYDKM